MNMFLKKVLGCRACVEFNFQIKIRLKNKFEGYAVSGVLIEVGDKKPNFWILTQAETTAQFENNYIVINPGMEVLSVSVE